MPRFGAVRPVRRLIAADKCRRTCRPQLARGAYLWSTCVAEVHDAVAEALGCVQLEVERDVGRQGRSAACDCGRVEVRVDPVDDAGAQRTSALATARYRQSVGPSQTTV